MNIALLVSALTILTVQQDTPTKTFTEPYLGIQFNYPATWTILKTTAPTLITGKTTVLTTTSTTGKKGSKGKLKPDHTRTIFSIPIANTLDKAELQVVRTEYHDTIDQWQAIINLESSLDHTTIVRQWQQDILGVPMLFSRVDSPGVGTPISALVGLFYTRTSFKLLFRLTCPTSSLDNVSYDFNKLLETLRQTDGKLPQVDDPTAVLEGNTKKPEFAAVTPHLIDAAHKGAKSLVKAPVTTEITVSTHKIILHTPEGWTAEKVKDNTLQLKNAGVSAPIEVQLFYMLDSDPPTAALIKQSAKGLDAFTKVASREDPTQKLNEAGCTIGAVWRVGQTSSGDLMMADLLGSMGSYYLLAAYRQSDRTTFKAERKLIEALMSQISIESPQ